MSIDRINQFVLPEDISLDGQLKVADSAEEVVSGKQSLKQLLDKRKQRSDSISDKPLSVQMAVDDLSIMDILEVQSKDRAESEVLKQQDASVDQSKGKLKKLVESFIQRFFWLSRV